MLSKRLEAIASFVDKNDNLIDVGCDHGYLGIYLKENNLVNNLLLTDINKNALNNAINNMQKLNLNIATKLTNGLDNIDTTNFNTIVISGMGTNTIKQILIPSKLKTIDKLIIQSNNHLAELRGYLKSLGFGLVDEITLKEKNIWYVICLFRKNFCSNYSEYGIPKKDKIPYYKYLIKNYQNILNGIPKDNIEIRKKYLNIIGKLNKLLEEC